MSSKAIENLVKARRWHESKARFALYWPSKVEHTEQARLIGEAIAELEALQGAPVDRSDL